MPGPTQPRGPSQAELNRRTYPRRRTTFPATYVVGVEPQRPAYGLDISGGGLCLLTQEQIPENVLKHLSLLALVGDKKVRFEAFGCWAVPTDVRGKKHYRYGLRMKQIADHDWNHVMEHSLDGEGGPGLTLGSILTSKQRETILPLPKQFAIADELTRKGRLTLQTDGRLPLVEYSFNGYSMQRGVPYYKLSVRSKVASNSNHTSEHHSHVLVAIEGDSIRVLD